MASLASPTVATFVLLLTVAPITPALPSVPVLGEQAVPEAASQAAPPASSLVTITLGKQYVPVIAGGKTVAHKTAYFGHVYVGFPKQQKFSVVFDTGSGHLFLPSAECVTPTCTKHNRYNREASTSGEDIDHDGIVVDAKNSADRDQVSIAYGTGEMVGDFVRDVVCLSDQTGNMNAEENRDCIKVRVITATEMTPEPFQHFEFDGVLGLGLESLALHPEFSFFGQMLRQKGLTEPRFGVFLSRTDEFPSEISFGGHDERRVSSEIHWIPMASPELGYWQVPIRRVLINEVPLPSCEKGGCVAIVDTGSSLLGVPKVDSQQVHMQLARRVPEENGDTLDCRNFPGPEIKFDLGSFEVSLGAEDYSRPAPLRVQDSKANNSETVICRATLLPVDMSDILGPHAWIFGEPLLRKYYTTYDMKKQQIGFATARQPVGRPDGVDSSSHTVLGAPSANALSGNTVVV